MGLWPMLLLSVLAAVPFLAVATCVDKDITSVSAYVDQCLSPTMYDNAIDPPGNGPIKVQVQFNLAHLNQVDQVSGFVSVGGYFRQWWKDKRLAYNASLVKRIKLKTDELVWHPDIFVENLVGFKNPSKGWSSTKLVDIFPDGTVYKSEMAVKKLKCAFTFLRLPFDRQDCKIIAASYSKNSSFMRVYPRKGRVGPGTSGEAMVGDKILSTIWHVMDGSDFALPGHVYSKPLDVGGVFDYIDMPFHFSRFPNFYRTVVLIPGNIFLCITYTGFFLPPKSVPARATVAVIPVLIMITLLNNVYKSLPQSAENMWLVTYLLVALVFAVLAVVQFGFVQLLLEREEKAQRNLETLRRILPVVKSVRKRARDKGLKTMNLVNKINEKGLAALSHIDLSEVDEPQTNSHSKTSPSPPGSPTGNPRAVKEADILGLNYIASIFRKHDFDGSNCLNHKEVCTALSYFNIWLCWKTTATAMCMFLRDSGEETPAKEEEVLMEFGRFTEFLIQINQYLIKAQTTTNLWHQFLQHPPSIFCDVICRWLFPISLSLVLIIMLLVK